MEFHTNDFQVAMMQIAYEMSKSVTVIENASVLVNADKDELILKRAKLVRQIFDKLATPTRSSD